jgi:ribosomal protein L37AE/L43A
MADYSSDVRVTRPEKCPFCGSGIVDTLAKVLTAATLWRCRSCEGTWTLAQQVASAPRPRSRIG